MRRTVGFLLLASLAVTGAAPLAGERLLCPMPCDACAMDAPATSASLEAASCCRVAPATEAETVPATVTAQRRGGITTHGDDIVVAEASVLCSSPTRYIPSFDPPAPVPAPSPPLLSTQTTRLLN